MHGMVDSEAMFHGCSTPKEYCRRILCFDPVCLLTTFLHVQKLAAA